MNGLDSDPSIAGSLPILGYLEGSIMGSLNGTVSQETLCLALTGQSQEFWNNFTWPQHIQNIVSNSEN